MLRILLTVILPIILPFLLYALFLFFSRKRAPAGAERSWQDAPWGWISGASLALLVATLITVRVMSGVEPGTVVEPPRLIDGEIQPARPVE